MPDPGSHAYDVRRTRLRAEYDDQGVPDQRADRAANEELQRDHPPRAVGERAAGPPGGGGGVEEDGGLNARSAAFSGHTMIPDRYSYEGGNTSPPLEWSDVPSGTAELALLCEDPDAPSGTFTHWVVTGIPADVTSIEEGAVPPGAVVGRNGFGEQGWGGPRPPVGDEPHRYIFRVYAVDRPLGLGEGVTADDLRSAIKGRVLAHGTLVGLFGR
ncbi:Raf kinase inhibitor-like YbhB/YbcL family protein [Saccharothrix ecbatanensis]|uniref:Raf kinase inhibitor-like YbhB/YbcL family protein n=1 Tax=Saccharothrix ecbatanensis TaxID=1105145 RepID=A0A7W9M047_9PSEU|nr:YbhB/YbcL family Raf kinase inhibitor-like protein [Saccharothrix ecbatanensis]MBB5802600.1 Raf kinase inhibitor-like YbhB/YbcL family protein [Saccharothrix ecbatanensis]